MNDPARERLIEVLNELTLIKGLVKQLNEANRALWSDQPSFKDAMDLSKAVNQLADHFCLNRKEVSDD